MRPRKYVLAHLTLRHALYAATAEGQLPDISTADSILTTLAPFCEDIEASARSEIEARESELEALRKELEAERAQRQLEQRAYEKALEQAQRDAVATLEQCQTSPLEDVRGFYVYYLWGRDGRLLYIGQSTNIHARLGSHMNNPLRRYQVGHISVTRCADSDAMSRLELLAIRQHAPEWNTAGVV